MDATILTHLRVRILLGNMPLVYEFEVLYCCFRSLFKRLVKLGDLFLISSYVMRFFHSTS